MAKVTTTEGVAIGTADGVHVSLDGEPNGFISTASYRVTEFELDGFVPTAGSLASYWMGRFDEIVKELNDLEEKYDRRGKTIHELTEKFSEKKRRIHDFYAPQLKNREDENRELERQKDRAEMWARWHKEDCAMLNKNIAALEAENDELKSKTSTSGETYRELRKERELYKSNRDLYKEMYSIVSEERSDLIAKLNKAETELADVTAGTNGFISAYAEAMGILNEATEKWNTEVVPA